MKLRQSLNWLLEQYIKIVEDLEQERREDRITISNAYRTAKLGVYNKVIQDLQGILEEGENE